MTTPKQLDRVTVAQLEELQQTARDLVKAHRGDTISAFTRTPVVGSVFARLFNVTEPSDYNEPHTYKNNHHTRKSKQLLKTIIGKATTSIKVVSGMPSGDLWDSDVVMDALEQKMQENPYIALRLIVPELSRLESNRRLSELVDPDNVKVITGVSPHFVVVDNTFWRLEEPHPDGKNKNSRVHAIVDTGTVTGKWLGESLGKQYDILFDNA